MTHPGRTLRSLLSIIFLDQTALTIAFPLVTLIFFDAQSRLFPIDTSQAVRSAWYGICVSLPYFINIFFAPILSSLSDQFGRKSILLIEVASAMLFALCTACGIYLGSLSLIFVGFIVRGAFSRTNPTALAIIGDTTPKDKKIIYMGYLQFAISIGATLGPFIGGYLADRFFFNTLNFALPFFVAAMLALSNTMLTYWTMPETLQQRTTSTSRIDLQAIKYVVTHPDVLRISLVLLLIQLSWSTYYQFIPPILKSLYQFNAHQLGIFIGMIAVWLALATSLGIKLLHHYLNVRQILLVAVYLVLIGLMLTLFACSKLLPADSILVWLGAIPVASGDVIAYSCLTALYSNVVAHEEQGKVMGVGLIVTGAAWATTAFLGGLLMGLSTLLPLIIAPAGVLTALALVHTTVGRRLNLAWMGG